MRRQFYLYDFAGHTEGVEKAWLLPARDEQAQQLWLGMQVAM